MLTEQVEELQKVNTALKENLVDREHSLEELENKHGITFTGYEQLKKAHEETVKERNQLTEEKMKIQAKYDSLYKQHQIEADRSRNEREQKYNDIIQLQQEN